MDDLQPPGTAGESHGGYVRGEVHWCCGARACVGGGTEVGGRAEGDDNLWWGGIIRRDRSGYNRDLKIELKRKSSKPTPIHYRRPIASHSIALCYPKWFSAFYGFVTSGREITSHIVMPFPKAIFGSKGCLLRFSEFAKSLT